MFNIAANDARSYYQTGWFWFCSIPSTFRIARPQRWQGRHRQQNFLQFLLSAVYLKYSPGPGRSSSLTLSFQREPMVHAGPSAGASSIWYSPGAGTSSARLRSAWRVPMVKAGPGAGGATAYCPGAGPSVLLRREGSRLVWMVKLGPHGL